MKGKLKNLFLVAVVPFLFASCNSGNDPVEKIKLAKATASLNVGQSETVKITDGNGGYAAVTDNSKVATVEIGKDKESVVITAVGAGEATITVTGKDADAAKLTVKVKDDTQLEYTVTKIAVEAGKTYGYKQGSTEGTFKVNSAAAGRVEIEIGNKKVVLLSDDGKSYLSKTFVGWDFETASKDTKSILFCLLAKSTELASATEAASEKIKNGAVETLFTAKAID